LAQRESILDVNLITEKDIEEGRGYALLSVLLPHTRWSIQ
jgi:hypothetical protein